MKDMYDIFQQSTVLSMIPLIKRYYRVYLGIDVGQNNIGSLDIDSEDNEGHFYRLRPTIRTQKYRFESVNQTIQKTLDAGELASILSAYFNTLLATTGTIGDLVAIKQYIEDLKNKNLTHSFISDYPEVSIVVRYIDGLYIAVIQQIKDKIYKGLSVSSQTNDQLLDPIFQHLEHLQAILPHLSLNDLIDFKDIITQLMPKDCVDLDDLSQRKTASVRILCILDEQIQKKLRSFMSYADVVTLIETFPTLQSQIQVKKCLTNMPDNIQIALDSMLEEAIRSTILELLYDYDKEVRQSMTDRHKSKKLQLIGQLKALCNENSSLDELYKAIQANETMLKTHPIGYYLYECICFVFNIKTNGPRSALKLFDATTSKVLDEEMSWPIQKSMPRS